MTATDTRPDQPAGDDDRPMGMDPDEQRSALVRLGLIIVAALIAAAVTGVTKTVAVIAALIIMIMLHELGHFLTAKWAGMKVTEYFLGFGPRLWSVRKGETEYGVKAIPAGGYVKIIGMNNIEEVAPEDEPRTYRQKPYWRRMSVAVAGTTMHFIIAIVLLFVLFAFVGRIDFDHPKMQVGEMIVFTKGQSPAQQAGFQLGDKIISIDGQHFSKWEDVPPYIQDRAGTPINFLVDRGGRQLTLTPTPVDRSTIEVKDKSVISNPDAHTGFIGIGPAFPVERTGAFEGVGRSFSEFGHEAKITVVTLGRVATFQGIKEYGDTLTGRAPAKPNEGVRFLSPVGVVSLAGDAANAGIRPVLILLISINIFVGIFNMIPLPPFDGGHVAIATYERIRSRKGKRYHADITKLMPVAYAVVMVLVFIAVSSVYLDIVRPAANPFQ